MAGAESLTPGLRGTYLNALQRDRDAEQGDFSYWEAAPDLTGLSPAEAEEAVNGWLQERTQAETLWQQGTGAGMTPAEIREEWQFRQTDTGGLTGWQSQADDQVAEQLIEMESQWHDFVQSGMPAPPVPGMNMVDDPEFYLLTAAMTASHADRRHDIAETPEMARVLNEYAASVDAAGMDPSQALMFGTTYPDHPESQELMRRLRAAYIADVRKATASGTQSEAMMRAGAAFDEAGVPTTYDEILEWQAANPGQADSVLTNSLRYGGEHYREIGLRGRLAAADSGRLVEMRARLEDAALAAPRCRR